ncbi:unnamed protein product, partial [Staurois parvus]
VVGIVPHHWCQCGCNSTPSLVSVGGIGAPSLVSVGGIVPHHWCQCGSKSTPSLVSVRGIVPRHCFQWEE